MAYAAMLIDPKRPRIWLSSANVTTPAGPDPFVWFVCKILLTFFTVITVDLVAVSLLTHKLRVWFPAWFDAQWATRTDPWVVYSQSYFAGIFFIPLLAVSLDHVLRQRPGWVRPVFWTVTIGAFLFILGWKGELMVRFGKQWEALGWLALTSVIWTAVSVAERLPARLAGVTPKRMLKLLARGVDGSVALYPLGTTTQANGMCVEVIYPAQVTADIARRGEELAEQVASLVDAVSIVAIEYFVTAKGLLVNEIALRPHNSGHWTIEGTSTSQFTNHLLAVSGQSLGTVAPLFAHAVMVVGSEQPGSLERARAVRDVAVHDYGKSWRPNRKLGHVTSVGDDPTTAHVRAWQGARAYGTSTEEA